MENLAPEVPDPWDCRQLWAIEDPTTSDSDGSVWYQVTFDGATGWVVSDYLALSGGSSSNAPSGPASNIVGQGLIAGTSGDGVRCRAAADSGSSVVTVVPEGAVVDLPRWV